MRARRSTAASRCAGQARAARRLLAKARRYARYTAAGNDDPLAFLQIRQCPAEHQRRGKAVAAFSSARRTRSALALRIASAALIAAHFRADADAAALATARAGPPRRIRAA
ncbi:MAG: hypothetical protein IPF57_25530 [Gammaproteobacteria bacterium]|nr:hypothetical protein [Gammaproteobacteria bacterium]